MYCQSMNTDALRIKLDTATEALGAIQTYDAERARIAEAVAAMPYFAMNGVAVREQARADHRAEVAAAQIAYKGALEAWTAAYVAEVIAAESLADAA